jgi:flagellar motor switch/type III secretory pathway protein FliN
MAAASSPVRAVEKLAVDSAPRVAAAEGTAESEEDTRWKPVLGLPCDIGVDLPVPGFRIADLLKLRAGSVINAHWRAGQDVPVRLNGTLIGWCEFEVMGNSLAVRLTELE